MCSKFLGGQTQSLGGPQARRFSVQEGPKSREHESLGCLWERMSRSHVWEMPPPSRPSWVLRCLSACWKYREILQGRHETKKFSFFFFNPAFPPNHLTVGQPTHHWKKKKASHSLPLSFGGVSINMSGAVVSRTCLAKHCARPVACRRSRERFPWLVFCSFTRWPVHVRAPPPARQPLPLGSSRWLVTAYYNLGPTWTSYIYCPCSSSYIICSVRGESQHHCPIIFSCCFSSARKPSPPWGLL